MLLINMINIVEDFIKRKKVNNGFVYISRKYGVTAIHIPIMYYTCNLSRIMSKEQM